MWIDQSVFYQIYPLGFCDAPKENDEKVVSRINKVLQWTDHFLKLGINAIYFSPIFDSDKHGYDTRDFNKIDCRLGTNDDFARVVKELHKNGIKVILDGVFNHVGRGFWAFQDVIENKENSEYKDWFLIDFNSNSCYNDGFWYDGWEGHYELVKLNLRNYKVIEHIFSSVKNWVQDYDIDGLRLDVAYCLDREFLKKLRTFANMLKPNFALIGEILFGDYNSLVNDEMLHSCTNYECYKGLYSSFNDMNMFEISYSLNRQFGLEQWTLYRGKHLLIFADNHDVSRLASILKNQNHLNLVYAILFAMPGIPCIYYGSEWGTLGSKSQGDDALRVSFEKPLWNVLTNDIKKFIDIHKNNKLFSYGSFKNIFISNHQYVFERNLNDDRIFVALNISQNESKVKVPINAKCTDLLTENTIDINGDIILKPYEVLYLKPDE